jgi:uncharacterized membrane protein YidH (DUF202 family)
MSRNAKEKDSAQKSRFLEVLTSVLAAMFGVQSRKKMEHDSKRENIVPYIATAFAMMVVLVIILAGISTFIVGHIK